MEAMNPCKKYTLDIPYPEQEGIKTDPAAAKLLMNDLAGPPGEITAIMQYWYAHLYADKMGFTDVAEAFSCIAMVEMHHMGIISELILHLGGDPKYLSYGMGGKPAWWNGSFVDYSKAIHKMLLEAIAGESTAIRNYKNHKAMIKDECVGAILTRIILDEEHHLEIFKGLMKKYNLQK